MTRDATGRDDISDEALVALADGELDAGETARLRRRINADPALAERFAAFAETRALLGTCGVEDDGFDRLAAAIRAAGATPATLATPAFQVIKGGAVRRPAPLPATARLPVWRRAMPALAASLALVIGGTLGYIAGRGGADGASAGGVAAISGAPGADLALASALERTPSGESLAWRDGPSGLAGEIAIVATHRLNDGRICREYEARVTGRDTVAAGLGCREAGRGWRTEIAAVKPAAGGGYATASGASVIDAAIEDLGGAGALPEEEEKNLLTSRWVGPQ